MEGISQRTRCCWINSSATHAGAAVKSEFCAEIKKEKIMEAKSVPPIHSLASELAGASRCA
jgi:hypothetical protein